MVEENDKPNKSDDTGTKPDPVPAEDKPLDLLGEVKAMRDEFIKAKESLKEEREKLQKVQAEGLLSGSAGGHVEAKPKEETPQEYVDRMRKNGWKADGN